MTESKGLSDERLREIREWASFYHRIDMSFHDMIDDLLAEVERLRAAPDGKVLVEERWLSDGSCARRPAGGEWEIIHTGYTEPPFVEVVPELISCSKCALVLGGLAEVLCEDCKAAQPSDSAPPAKDYNTVYARCEKCRSRWQYDRRERFGADRRFCSDCEVDDLLAEAAPPSPPPSPWVAVESQMPPEGVEVEACQAESGFRSYAKWFPETADEIGCWAGQFGHRENAKFFSHWRKPAALPAPPEREKEK